MWGLNHGFPRNISTPTTPTEIAPTKHSVHLKEQEVSDLRGVFTPMFCALLLAAAVMMLRPLPYHSIYPFKFIHEWISPLDSFGSANIWCVCYIFLSHSIIGAIESCSAFYENTLEALDASLFQKVFFLVWYETHKNCGKETTSLCKRMPSLLTLRSSEETVNDVIIEFKETSAGGPQTESMSNVLRLKKFPWFKLYFLYAQELRVSYDI